MMNKEVTNPWKKPYIRFISERKADKTRIVTAPKGCRGIISYVDFIDDVITTKASASLSATGKDFDGSIGATVVGPSDRLFFLH